jgi:hypothetical protein
MAAWYFNSPALAPGNVISYVTVEEPAASKCSVSSKPLANGSPPMFA